MEENNRKGTGVFYAVVGVATLVVAIIGATFAFFSANATNENITGSTAAAGGIELAVTKITDTGSNMIPLNLQDNTNPANAATGDADQFAKALTGKCKDANGNNVCQIYSITVSNKSTTSAVQVRGTLTLDTEAAANMKWQLLTNDTATTRAGFATTVDKGVAGNVTVDGNTSKAGTGTTAASQTLAASGTATYYVLVWLEETGKAQETADAAKTFKGTVTFNAVDAGGNTSGLTASFSA